MRISNGLGVRGSGVSNGLGPFAGGVIFEGLLKMITLYITQQCDIVLER